MQRKCEYCGVAYEDSLPACPQCGAPNEYRRATGIEVPKTIEELATWYAEKNLPPEEVTRFFIGKDVREPKAFGIYKRARILLYTKIKPVAKELNGTGAPMKHMLLMSSI